MYYKLKLFTEIPKKMNELKDLRQPGEDLARIVSTEQIMKHDLTLNEGNKNLIFI